MNSGSYSDLSFSIALNLPPGASAHYLDNFQVGQVSTPPAPVSSEPRPDYVGVTRSGAAAVAVDSEQVQVPLTYANFEIKAIDAGCVPSPTNVCRYSLTTMHLWFGAFSIAGMNVSRLKATNNRSVEFALGGNHPPAFTLPPTAELVAWITSDKLYSVTFEPAASLFTFDPTGSGTLSVLSLFTAEIQGKQTGIAFSATADTPLLNRPPVADAGPDAVVSKASGSCEVNVTLDGSGSTDPDNNLAYYRWTAAGFALGNTAQQPTVPFRRSLAVVPQPSPASLRTTGAGAHPQRGYALRAPSDSVGGER